jgi:pyochelin synthetase
VATEAQKAAATVLQNHDLANILQYADALDRAALASMLQAFRGAGLFANGQVQTSEQIVAALSVHARYRRLLRRWLNAACEHGVLVRERVHDDIGYRLTSSGQRLAAAREWELVERWPHCYDPPELLSYFRACGTQLPALISGKQSALQLFYPEGRSDVPLGLYEHAFFNRWGNQVTAAVVRVLADATARGRPIRLLEIGAGQGGLTDCVLGALDKDYDYVVSEISEYFLAATRNKFKDNASVHFARYDLNLGYRDQGIAPNSFDIIVVGDTLHIARNVPKALTELREILTPGGWLVAMEMVRDHCQIMTSLEFLNATDDAGPTYDDDREFRDQTFFTRDQWLELLQQSEADIVEVAPRSDEIIAEVGVCVFAARYKPGRAVLSAKQLTEFLRIRLPDYMVPNEIQIVDRIPLTVNGKVDRVRLANSPIAPPVGAGSADLIGDDLTRRIASIWATVLGHAPGADTEFFSAGGDSLLAAQLAGQICEKVPEADAIYFDELLRRVLEGPTLAALAQIVRAAGAPGSAPHANERPEGRTVEGDGLICLGGALGQPVCVLISDEEGQQACTDSLKRALVDRCRVYELPIGSVDRDIPREAMRFHFLIRNANLSDPHLVGFGGGNLIAVELGRQMLEDGDIRPTVTVTSLTPGLMTGHDAATVHYAGDINLLCFGRDFRAEAYWRNACLGDLKITELRNLDSLHIASFLAAPSGK